MRRIGSEVQVRKEHLTRPQHLALERLRLLDLDDELRASKHIRLAARDGSARRAILRVVYPDAVAGAGLDDHFMAGSDELANTRRHQADAILMNLDFPRNTDAHGQTLEKQEGKA